MREQLKPEPPLGMEPSPVLSQDEIESKLLDVHTSDEEDSSNEDTTGSDMSGATGEEEELESESEPESDDDGGLFAQYDWGTGEVEKPSDEAVGVEQFDDTAESFEAPTP